MADREKWDVCVARPKANAQQGESDVWWHRLGSAYKNDKGQLVIFLDSLPLPNAEGVVQVMGFVPRPKEEGAGRGAPAARSAAPARTGRAAGDGARGRGRASAPEDDEEIPF